MKFGTRLFAFILIAALLAAMLPASGYADSIALESPAPTTETVVERIYSKISTRLVLIVTGVVCAAAGAAAIAVILVRRDKDKRKKAAENRDKSALDDLIGPDQVSTIPDSRPWNGPGGVRRVSSDGLFLFLCCRGGYQDGREYPLNPEVGDSADVKVVTIGRASESSIKYPDNWPGVSRHHAVVKVYRDGGKRRVELTDVSSTGSFLKKGSRGENKANPLPRNIPVELEPGDVFYIGSPDNRFELVGRACGLGY